MQDAAVVTGLVAGGLALGLQHGDAGAAVGERQGGGEADDAAADDGDVRCASAAHDRES
jgi:hypothetical protein